ncbi:MAG: transporter substrate-binding domain-containing protein [Alphaproteobacteria bacterium]|nr:transporter substrate-binding domain-containing protein [Alphaproteobacteria bacterium]
MSKTISWIALVLAAVALALVMSRHAPTSGGESKKETAYERVMQSNTLRCGYGTWKPGVYKDAETNKMEGLFVELIEAMGRFSNIKIEWTAETDWGQIPESISSGKIDAFCAGMAADAARGKRLAYTNPLSFWTFDVLVRADDTRFPAGQTIRIADLNKADYATAYSEGDVLETIVKNEFPAVRGMPLPPLGTPADNLMHVTTRKTDFVVFPKIMFQSYEKANPGQLRYLRVEPPLRAYGNVIAVGIDDLKLQQLLNAAVNELVNSGSYAQIMSRYDQEYPGAFLRIASTYVSSTSGKAQ